MSDIPPSQSMIPPSTSPSYPELCYNEASNTYAHNNIGAWVPHPGICNAFMSHQPFHMETGTYALGPAKFASQTDSPSPSSCVNMHQVPGNNAIDPALLPLPDTSDLDLMDAITIAEAHDYIAAAKTANVNCLLNMVKDELPLANWAKVNHQPSHKITLLELVKTMKPTGDSICPPQVICAHHIDHLINKHAETYDLNDLDFENENINNNNNNNHSIVSDQDEPYCASPLIQHTAIARSTAHTETPIPHCNA
ncbi:uncharacterized protein EDB93DRAFT_1248562 [Suillus bovinus]|uniref:uncharacterized protein n=1 Tax=Suillus bovinus TaxID=48563 RepID=UPI001B87BB79|nr:uncharacterized protein EDB93DRAFT_1248562 [Suillus bovinus]KAG2153660.1 hypothetical protein EDB93DRAFT_1248562 [Suillus bovinus]